jgi:hypothetical protein
MVVKMVARHRPTTRITSQGVNTCVLKFMVKRALEGSVSRSRHMQPAPLYKIGLCRHFVLIVGQLHVTLHIERFSIRHLPPVSFISHKCGCHWYYLSLSKQCWRLCCAYADSSLLEVICLKSSTSTGYFSNSTCSFATSGQLSRSLIKYNSYIKSVFKLIKLF